jgi:hypothetical protein
LADFSECRPQGISNLDPPAGQRGEEEGEGEAMYRLGRAVSLKEQRENGEQMRCFLPLALRRIIATCAIQAKILKRSRSLVHLCCEFTVY